MDTGLEALTTALYVTVDDLLKDHPEQAPARPAVGLAPLTSDAEVITLAVVQALLSYTSEARWLRRVGSDGNDIVVAVLEGKAAMSRSARHHRAET